MKTNILMMSLALALFSCDKKEITRLQSKVDSLNTVIIESQRTEAALNEVGVMLDSIDASRHALHTKIVEGFSYADYVNRLRDINTSIKDSQKKLADLEKRLKDSKSSSLATINRLKRDLDLKSKEIVELQMDVVALREKNNTLVADVSEKEIIISSQEEVIKMKEADVASLVEQAQITDEKNRVMVADLYFAEAKALEDAAHRTQFAPRKKKETKREALEMYKLSFSLGNKDAEAKIQELEKVLSD
jgi:hypothetical protein